MVMNCKNDILIMNKLNAIIFAEALIKKNQF